MHMLGKALSLNFKKSTARTLFIYLFLAAFGSSLLRMGFL